MGGLIVIHLSLEKSISTSKKNLHVNNNINISRSFLFLKWIVIELQF